MPPATLRGLAAGPGLLLIEGAMGLFDGAADGRGSVADLAMLLDLPVILIVDAARMAQSVGPLVAGFAAHDRRVRIAGVILNRVGGDRHGALLRAACPLPVLGVVPRDPGLATPLAAPRPRAGGGARRSAGVPGPRRAGRGGPCRPRRPDLPRGPSARRHAAAHRPASAAHRHGLGPSVRLRLPPPPGRLARRRRRDRDLLAAGRPPRPARRSGLPPRRLPRAARRAPRLQPRLPALAARPPRLRRVRRVHGHWATR